MNHFTWLSPAEMALTIVMLNLIPVFAASLTGAFGDDDDVPISFFAAWIAQAFILMVGCVAWVILKG